MKKILFTILFIILAIAITMVALKCLSNEDDWICQDGQWVKHGHPYADMPTEPCPDSDIVVYSPQRNQTVESPILIKGKARGNWFFEADFPVRLLDEENKEIAVGYVQALSDWMTEDFIAFENTLEFSVSEITQAKLILQKDNPSGLPEYDKEIEIPVVLNPGTTKVKVYFNNSQMDPEYSCDKVFPVEREIAKERAIARAALQELLRGPTEEEKKDGYITNINENVKIQSLTIEDGTARVDFNEQLEYQVGGSCRVAAIRSEITETLKQFSTVNNVIISINGRTEDILQP